MSSMSFMSSSSGGAPLRDLLAAAAVARSAGTGSRSTGRICVPGAVLAFASAGGAAGAPASSLRPARAARRD